MLRPVVPGAPAQAGEGAPAWPAIERAQKQMAREYWLISQPDHAGLSGDLAANFVARDFPRVEPAIARAIEVHDAGWALFDPEARVSAPPFVDGRGKPVSFIEIAPPDFLRAWVASIDRAETVCPAGGYIVSRHFCALGEGRLSSAIDTLENTGRLRAFLRLESERQARLQAVAGRSPAELEELLLVLQFCDLLSLYLCCGAAEAVEFPQPFAPGKIRLRRQNQAYILEPSPFRAGRETDAMLSLGVEARYYPADRSRTTTLAFLLW